MTRREMSAAHCTWYLIAVAYSPDNTGRNSRVGGNSLRQIDLLARNLQPYKAVDLLNMFLQFLQDRGGEEKGHKYRLCILLLVAGIFH